MVTRTISVSEGAYRLLEKMRLPGEDLEDTILRLCGLKTRGKGFDKTLRKALDEVVTEDADLLKRLAQ